MKREYYIDGEQVTKNTFFKYLEIDVFKYCLGQSNKMKLLKYTLWFIAETTLIVMFLALWWR